MRTRHGAGPALPASRPWRAVPRAPEQCKSTGHVSAASRGSRQQVVSSCPRAARRGAAASGLQRPIEWTARRAHRRGGGSRRRVRRPPESWRKKRGRSRTSSASASSPKRDFGSTARSSRRRRARLWHSPWPLISTATAIATTRSPGRSAPDPLAGHLLFYKGTGPSKPPAAPWT